MNCFPSQCSEISAQASTSNEKTKYSVYIAFEHKTLKSIRSVGEEKEKIFFQGFLRKRKKMSAKKITH